MQYSSTFKYYTYISILHVYIYFPFAYILYKHLLYIKYVSIPVQQIWCLSNLCVYIHIHMYILQTYIYYIHIWYIFLNKKMDTEEC